MHPHTSTQTASGLVPQPTASPDARVVALVPRSGLPPTREAPLSRPAPARRTRPSGHQVPTPSMRSYDQWEARVTQFDGRRLSKTFPNRWSANEWIRNQLERRRATRRLFNDVVSAAQALLLDAESLRAIGMAILDEARKATAEKLGDHSSHPRSAKMPKSAQGTPAQEAHHG